MARKPSLHIKHSDLFLILKERASEEDAAKTMEHILRRASEFPVRRSIIVTTARAKKKLLAVNTSSVELFNRVLTERRQSAGHVKFRQILKTDRQYQLLCEVSKDAEEFCKLYEISETSGFRVYCDLGIKKIGKNWGLNKFKTYKDHIFDRYERQLAISNNKNKALTDQILDYYLSTCNMHSQKRHIWELYAHDFVYATEAILEAGADYKQWIDIQFKALKEFDVIPNPYNLHGEFALKAFLSKGKAVTVDDWRAEALKRLK